MAARPLLPTGTPTAALGAMEGTGSGPLAHPAAWVATLKQGTETLWEAPVVSVEVCSLEHQAQVVEVVVLKPRREPLPAGLADRAGSM